MTTGRINQVATFSTQTDNKGDYKITMQSLTPFEIIPCFLYISMMCIMVRK